MKPTRIEAGPDQESVWDYPRPPRVENVAKRIQVVFNGIIIADTKESSRVLETSHPPVYYIPQKDIRMESLAEEPTTSFCEWKGRAKYYTVIVGNKSAQRAAWCYPDPMPTYEVIRNHVAFYAGAMDGCYLDGERVTPQPGGFYGGWVTRDIVGAFKGEPGTADW